MKNLVKSCFLLFLFMCQLSPSFGQGFLRTQGQAIVNETGDTMLLKGIGLGGWMLQEGYMLQTADFATAQYQIRAKIEELIGETYTDEFYDAWLTNHMRKTDVDSLKSWGFNCVRLPMHYNLFTLPVEEEPVPGQNTWLTKGFELTDSLLSWCKQNNMYVLLDLHAAPGGQGYDQAISDYDPEKPSLWESTENQDKTVALWRHIAEYYADEPWIMGYDLLNEPNWDLPGNQSLRALYQRITDAIREVDTNHMIFIEGNWFANDFTGLTPPWDDNMVYSPHKYWSINDQASIQWVLDIRDQHDVPLYFGETGENSNTWFRDAARLFETNGLGWAWWPLKKVESISGPLSVKKPAGYDALLNYWKGSGTKPSVASARATLLQLAENLKTENCEFHKDVIDALFRQPFDDTAIPFRTQDIPGVVYTTDFDLGIAGSAYDDSDLANYSVSTGTFTAWNNGWSYRNDGVDIEPSLDLVNSNGYGIGFPAPGEWMQYDVRVAQSGVYDVEIRVAANSTSGRFHLAVGETDITGTQYVPNTQGWQNWQNRTVQNIVLDTSDHKIRFYSEGEGFNIGSMNFIFKSPSTASVTTRFTSAITDDRNTVRMNTNKALHDALPAAPGGFSIFVNGNSVPLTGLSADAANPRIIRLTVGANFKASDEITISYNGTAVEATDGTKLQSFSMEPVTNTVSPVHLVPGHIEAEDFFEQSGIQLETTTDVGGGQNIGYLDVGDYVDYLIEVQNTGTYNVDFRTASEGSTGGILIQLVQPSGSTIPLTSMAFPPTGGWQTWTTTSKTMSLVKGQHRIRLLITQPNFNINWFEFSPLNAAKEAPELANIRLFPNPGSGLFHLRGEAGGQFIGLRVHNLLGQTIWQKKLHGTAPLEEDINLYFAQPGTYWLTFYLRDGRSATRKLILVK